MRWGRPFVGSLVGATGWRAGLEMSERQGTHPSASDLGKLELRIQRGFVTSGPVGGLAAATWGGSGSLSHALCLQSVCQDSRPTPSLQAHSEPEGELDSTDTRGAGEGREARPAQALSHHLAGRPVPPVLTPRS